jgi:Fur family ferric uptake transcriptional regulator
VEGRDLRKAGLKVTSPRLKVLEVLEHSRQRHLSAEAIYRALLDSGEELGLATVYRVLTQFERAGLVSRHNFEGGQAVFELADRTHHDHMVCLDTGRVTEFYDERIEQIYFSAENRSVPLFARSIISAACARVRAVTSTPPSIRDNSSTRSLLVSARTSVRLTLPSVCFATR